MLYIEFQQTLFKRPTIVTWHIGDDVPSFNARVVKFQADGDELLLFLRVMRESAKYEFLQAFYAWRDRA